LQLVRVIEFQRRGLAHVHALVRGAVSPDILRLAVRGGINPRTGRRVSGTTSGGFSFGPQCDVRNVEDAGRVGAPSHCASHANHSRRPPPCPDPLCRTGNTGNQHGRHAAPQS
jgi:hypothetical protein